MIRILLIGSGHPPDGTPESEIHEQMINRNPNLTKFDFKYLGIRKNFSTAWDFEKQLKILSTQFKPDYVLVHTGLEFRENPSIVVTALINLSRILTNVKIGFQGGKDEAIKKILVGGFFRYARGLDQSNSHVVEYLENASVFQETDDLIKIVREVYSPQV